MTASAGAVGADPADPHNWLQNFDIAMEILCPVLALIVTSLRVYSRLKLNAFGWDDICIIVAMILSIIEGVGTIMYMKILYVGIPMEQVPKDIDIEQGLIWIYVVGSVYNPILAIVKQSVLIFLLRLASIKPKIRTIVWITAVFNACLMIATLLCVVFQCTPVNSYWNRNVKGHCIDQISFAVASACMSILTDIIALALPFWIFLGLKIDKKKKIALMIVFLLGLLVTVVSVLRLYYLWPEMGLIKEKDPDYSFSFDVAAIEVNLAIITASGPALWPLIRSVAPRLMTSIGGPSKKGYHQSHYADGWTPHGTHRSSHVVKGGGGQYALRDLKDSRVMSRNADRESDEEVLTREGGIHRVIQISVSRDIDSQLDEEGVTTS